MKIHAYRVTQRGTVPLPALLEFLQQRDHEGRVATLAEATVTLEEVTRDNLGNWRMDFAKLRQFGPGRASLTRPIASFDLDEDESFGEETAVYYDPSLEYMVIQYNHHGPRFNAIESYLFDRLLVYRGQHGGGDVTVNGNGFGVIPVLRPDTSARLQRMSLVKKLEFTAYVSGLSLDSHQAQPSLRQILNGPLVESAESITVCLNAGRSRASSLSLARARELIGELLGMREDISQLRIEGRDDEDAPREPLDLLEARLQADIPVPRGTDHRYGRAERWAALKQAFDVWRGDGKLPA